jgi:putative ABC transport system substrate-binding protein
MPVIGYLNSTSPGPAAPFVAALRQGLSETGYVEGQNVSIEYRWAEGRYDRLPALAAELVVRKVAAIATMGGIPTLVAAKRLPRRFRSSSFPGPIRSRKGWWPVSLGPAVT